MDKNLKRTICIHLYIYIYLNFAMYQNLAQHCEPTMHVYTKSLQSYLTLCSPMDYNQPGSSVHGILQARILEWVAMPSSRGSS